MTERPISFDANMVRAILEDRKTALRSSLKGDQIPHEHPSEETAFRWSAVGQHDPRYGFLVTGKTERECVQQLAMHGTPPYGRPGDRIWVREAWRSLGLHEHLKPSEIPPVSQIQYPATEDSWVSKLRRGQHMPRWASRILLEVTDVRIERLQQITEEQAVAEGVLPPQYAVGPYGASAAAGKCRNCGQLQREHVGTARACNGGMATHWNANSAKGGFGVLWDQTHGTGAWHQNPWVWVTEFKRIDED